MRKDLDGLGDDVSQRRWVLVLNRTEAKIFLRINHKEIRLVTEIVNPIGRDKNRELTSDKPSIDKFRVKQGMVTFGRGSQKNPHEDAAVQFAKKVAEHLHGEKSRNQFTSLTVIADPHMLGLLKSNISGVIEESVSDWIPKNYSKFSAPQIVDSLNAQQPQIEL